MSPDSAPPGNRGFSGVVAGEEPRAMLVGRDVILAGGNAADAAAAMGLSLSVTLPSRAGLGGGGICTVYDTRTGKSEILDFIQKDATPMTARGMAALLARYGARGWSNAVANAETLARFGFPVSKMLADDLAVSGGVLMSDQAALAAFMDRRRQFVAAGAEIRLPQMAETLQSIRTQGAVALSGTSTVAPTWRAASMTSEAGVAVAGPESDAAPNARNNAVAATNFVVGDKNGLAVSCVLSMGTPFGSGRTAPGTGYFVANTAASALSARPVIALDAQHSHVVLMAAAYGPAAQDLTQKIVNGWLAGGQSYDQTRSAIQTAVSENASSSIVAATCPSGLAIMGLSCRTMTDVKSFGLGLTFGPDTPR